MTKNILNLPVDILVNVLKKLGLSDLRNVILTCKTLRSLVVNDNTIWRSICRDKLILEDPLHNRSNNEQNWYNRCRISNNWCSGYFKNKVIVQFHSNYMPWLKLHNSEILAVSKGSELLCYAVDRKKIPNSKSTCWTLSVPTVSRNDVRTHDISRFVIRNNTLVCGNRDGSTAVYKIPYYKQKPLLLHHIQDCHENGQVEVSAVELIETSDFCYIVTASNNSQNIIFWQSNENGYNITDSIMDIPIHNGEGVRCMAVNNVMDKLAIGLDGNSKPLLLDIHIGKYLMTADSTRNSKQAIRDIGWHNNNTIMYVTHSGMLHLMDTRTNDFVRKTDQYYCINLKRSEV
ncbi:hypothetical protein O3G_MSEX009552 [Manduca sexta]|uniref:F-box domain-containing protein n=1 Tax=Manduca sexta TaxID=7130 RepID=A0A921ZDR6_MANSE|nr:hypothetical protein O3G_MSEX009552 [Manduca sexta]